jgi:hypothetical protein
MGVFHAAQSCEAALVQEGRSVLEHAHPDALDLGLSVDFEG